MSETKDADLLCFLSDSDVRMLPLHEAFNRLLGPGGAGGGGEVTFLCSKKIKMAAKHFANKY